MVHPGFSLFFVLVSAVLASGSAKIIPVGLGHHVHLCGDIVDENLAPVSDALQLEISVTRPLIDLKGNVRIDEYKGVIADSKFCLKANFCGNLIATVTGERIVPSSISIGGLSMHRNGYKWVVEKRARPLKRPSLRNGSLSSHGNEDFEAISLWGDRTFASRKSPVKDTVGMDFAKMIFSVVGLNLDKKHLDASRKALSEKLGQPIREVRGYSPHDPLFEFSDTWSLVGFYLEARSDSLFFKPGPLVRPRFAHATLDSPACYFGRMADPPPRKNPLWSDSLLIAVGGKLVSDGFYVYFPWTENWGKAILDTRLGDEKGPHAVRFALVVEPYGKTASFEFYNIDGSTLYTPYHARRKCHTPMEKLTRDVYPTRIRPGVEIKGLPGKVKGPG